MQVKIRTADTNTRCSLTPDEDEGFSLKRRMPVEGKTPGVGGTIRSRVSMFVSLISLCLRAASLSFPGCASVVGFTLRSRLMCGRWRE